MKRVSGLLYILLLLGINLRCTDREKKKQVTIKERQANIVIGIWINNNLADTICKGFKIEFHSFDSLTSYNDEGKKIEQELKFYSENLCYVEKFESTRHKRGNVSQA
jgi:hypothetical protein